jgi:hypothetical protein
LQAGSGVSSTTKFPFGVLVITGPETLGADDVPAGLSAGGTRARVGAGDDVGAGVGAGVSCWSTSLLTRGTKWPKLQFNHSGALFPRLWMERLSTSV